MHESKKQRLHRAAAKKYADLGLHDGEYVVSDVRRHALGRIRIWIGVSVVVAVLVVAAIFFAVDMNGSGEPGTIAAMIFLIIALFTPFCGAVLVRDYDEDWMIVTNLRVIQNIRHTAFADENQEIGLDGIEDVSFHQDTIWQKMFNYGSLRLSTIGNEHTYIFTWVANPSDQVKAIRQAVSDYHQSSLSGKRATSRSVSGGV